MHSARDCPAACRPSEFPESGSVRWRLRDAVAAGVHAIPEAGVGLPGGWCGRLARTCPRPRARPTFGARPLDPPRIDTPEHERTPRMSAATEAQALLLERLDGTRPNNTGIRTIAKEQGKNPELAAYL